MTSHEAIFIAAAYNAEAFPLDLFELRSVDVEISDDMLICLDALRWGRADLHTLVPDGDRRVRAVIERWGMRWPDDCCLTTMSTRLIFVFGSNLAGRHGKGAALAAIRQHGAIYGRGVGPQASRTRFQRRTRACRRCRSRSSQRTSRSFCATRASTPR